MSKKLITSFILIIITLAVLLILVRPIWQSVWNEQVEIKTKEVEIVSINDILDKTNQFKQVEEQAEKVFLALPKKKDTPNLLVQFDSLAMTNSMILESIDFSDLQDFEYEQSDDPFPNILVDLRVSGTYNDFQRYLLAVESNIRSMDVTSIGFKSNLLSSFLAFDLTIKVYYQ